MIRNILCFFKIKNKIKKIAKDETGGSMIESGLLIALSLILFLMLIAIVTDVYGWIEEKFRDIIGFFGPLN